MNGRFKHSVGLAAVIFSVTAVLLTVGLSGCRGGSGDPTASSTASNLAAVTADVGRTLNDLRLQHPDYGFLSLDGYDFSAECLGSEDGTFAYAFFGTQAGPGLGEAASRYGDQLKCAGVCTTAGRVFSVLNDGALPVGDFLSSIGLNVNDPEKVSFWAGWVFFDYENYSFAVNTKDADGDVDAVPKAGIKKDSPMIIEDDELWSANGELISAAQ